MDVPQTGEEPGLAWYRWHQEYDDLSSARVDRLGATQQLLGQALDRAAPGVVRLVSSCAGQGRDVLPVLLDHPRGAHAQARLVELDPLNAGLLRSALGSTALAGVEVLEADAGSSSAYEGAVPADVVLLSGVLDRLGPDEGRRAVLGLPLLCAAGATVVWAVDDPTGAVAAAAQAWLAEAGFAELDLRRGPSWAAGAALLEAAPRPWRAGERWFSALQP